MKFIMKSATIILTAVIIHHIPKKLSCNALFNIRMNNNKLFHSYILYHYLIPGRNVNHKLAIF